MSAGTRPRAGRRASLPAADWAPPERLTDSGSLCQVLYISEDGRGSKVYDFTRFAVDPLLQQWLARAFARATGPASGIKRVTAANSLWDTLAWFAGSLRDAERPPQSPAQITPAHIAAAWLSLTPASRKTQVERMRTIFREDQNLLAATRAAILHGRLPDYESEVQPYTRAEHQVLMTAVRHDVREARDRIAAGRELLARYRRGELGPAGYNRMEKIGRALDMLDHTGHLPRETKTYQGHEVNYHPGWIHQSCGGARKLFAMLTLTRLELMAFALLLTDLTAENFGTICAWPAANFRPDGDLGGPALALVDATKPRRGPSREFMLTTLEDLPPSLGDVLVGEDDKHLFRSPLRAYLLLLDLTQLARHHAGSDLAFCYPDPGSPHGERWIEGTSRANLADWARRHGFPPEPRKKATADQQPADTGAEESRAHGQPGADVRPSVNLFRLRRFSVERRGRPVAHSGATFRDDYLRTSRAAQTEGRAVVREALELEISKARTVQEIPVLTHQLLDLARRDPRQAAQQTGMDVDTLHHLISGDQDTVLVGCTAPEDSPFTAPGKPCGASFLTDCLRCENARALPRHLPIQLEVHDRLALMRPNMDRRVWDHRYADPFARLTDLLRKYTPGERADARPRLTQDKRRLVDDLMSGRLELR